MNCVNEPNYGTSEGIYIVCESAFILFAIVRCRLSIILPTTKICS